jgi:hypothetical protein
MDSELGWPRLPSPGAKRQLQAGDIAISLAGIDPDRAERLIRSITYERRRAEALRYLAKALVDTDADRAEHIVQTITDEGIQAEPLRDSLCGVARRQRSGRAPDNRLVTRGRCARPDANGSTIRRPEP